ncbi:SufE family protein [Candidatus Woesearchaeota archaeon]|nr:SufE family protein [Candidatus Woesearchaeota archaeon]
MPIKERLATRQEELQMMENQREMLEYLIEIGKELPDFPVDFMEQHNEVPGCVSKVYIIVSKDETGIHVRGTANALIVKGYLAILFEALEGASPQEILEEGDALIGAFVEASGLNVSMVASRANAFANVFRFIKQKVKDI